MEIDRFLLPEAGTKAWAEATYAETVKKTKESLIQEVLDKEYDEAYNEMWNKRKEVKEGDEDV